MFLDFFRLQPQVYPRSTSTSLNKTSPTCTFAALVARRGGLVSFPRFDTLTD